MPKLAQDSVGGLGVGVKSWGFGLFAIFGLLLSGSTFAAGPSGKDYDATAPPIPAEIVGPDATIKMSDDMPMYQPPMLTIHAGQTVEWKNAGLVSHSVTDDATRATNAQDALVPKNAKAFTSGGVMPGGTFRHTFTVPGRYRYFCLSHEVDKMVGEIIVEEVPGASRSKWVNVARPKPKTASVAAGRTAPADESQPWRALDRASASDNQNDQDDP